MCTIQIQIVFSIKYKKSHLLILCLETKGIHGKKNEKRFIVNFFFCVPQDD